MKGSVTIAYGKKSLVISAFMLLGCHALDEMIRLRPLNAEEVALQGDALSANTAGTVAASEQLAWEQTLGRVLRELNRSANHSVLMGKYLPSNEWFGGRDLTVDLVTEEGSAYADCEHDRVVVSVRFLWRLAEAARSVGPFSTRLRSALGDLRSILDRFPLNSGEERSGVLPPEESVSSFHRTYVDLAIWVLGHELYHLRDRCPAETSLDAEVAADRFAAGLIALDNGLYELDNRVSGLLEKESAADALEKARRELMRYVEAPTFAPSFALDLMDRDLIFFCPDGLLSKQQRLSRLNQATAVFYHEASRWKRLQIFLEGEEWR